jgi:hypothetical protein
MRAVVVCPTAGSTRDRARRRTGSGQVVAETASLEAKEIAHISKRPESPDTGRSDRACDPSSTKGFLLSAAHDAEQRRKLRETSAPCGPLTYVSEAIEST